MQKWLLTLCLIFLIAGCGKDGDPPANPSDTAAVFSLTSPPANVVYPNGTIIQVTGNVTDPNGLKKVRMEIRHRTSGIVYNSQEVTLNNETFHFFHWTWQVATMTSLTPGTVRLISTDRFDYQTTKDVDIQMDN